MSFIAEISKAIQQEQGDKLGSSLATVKSATSKKVKIEIDGAEIEAFYNLPGKPKKGAKCIVNFPEGSPDRATASGFSELDEIDTTIADVVIKINTDGVIIELNGSSQKFSLKGDVEVDGKITATNEIKSDVDVKTGLISLKNHTHIGNLGSPTSPPV